MFGRILFVLAFICLSAYIALPVYVFAQSEELRAVIRAEIMKDPRASGISADELERLVDALALEAERGGMTTEDITWRPQESGSAPAQALPSFDTKQMLLALGGVAVIALLGLWLGIFRRR